MMLTNITLLVTAVLNLVTLGLGIFAGDNTVAQQCAKFFDLATPIVTTIVTAICGFFGLQKVRSK